MSRTDRTPLPLPPSGHVPLEQLLEALTQGRDLLRVSPEAALRSVWYQSEDKWRHLATVLRVGQGGARAQDRRIAGLRLLERPITIDQSGGVDTFCRLLSDWAEVDPVQGAETFSDTARVERHESIPAQGIPPMWRIELSPNTTQTRSGSLPPGPFFDATDLFYAQNVPVATARWLMPDHYDKWDVRDEFVILLPDYRALFEKVELRKHTLAVQIRFEPGLDLYCCGSVTGVSGAEQIITEKVVGPELTLELDERPQSVVLHILDADSVLYDRYWGPGIARGLMLPVATDAESAIDQLQTDTNEGEGQHVEFKAWIPVNGEKEKRRELLEVLVAFANAEGGRLYIGVSDQGEIKGVDIPVQKHYRELNPNDAEASRNQYVRDIRRLIAEGIQRTLVPSVQWLELAGLHVLCLEIERGNQRPYYLAENREILIRAGATNRRALPHELQAFYARPDGFAGYPRGRRLG